VETNEVFAKIVSSQKKNYLHYKVIFRVKESSNTKETLNLKLEIFFQKMDKER
jgi:hypothetical protein